jgi:hypothetical protein
VQRARIEHRHSPLIDDSLFWGLEDHMRDSGIMKSYL